MRITKGQLIITVEKHPEGYLASVNRKYDCGCTGFYRETPCEAIECAIKYFEESFR